MKHIEHIGIAVKNLEVSIKMYETLLNTKPYKEEYVESEQVTTVFFKTGETQIELLASDVADSAISKFIEKKGEGIHHIAFAVDDIDKETNRLKKEGFMPLFEQAKKGADNKMVMFFHPKTTGGVLIEICQEIAEQ